MAASFERSVNGMAFISPSISSFNTSPSVLKPNTVRLYRFPRKPAPSFRSRHVDYICSQGSPTDSSNAKNNSEQNSYATVELARTVMDHAFTLADGDPHVVAKECAVGFVDAFSQCYQSAEYPAVFVVVGHGFTGLVGMYIALQLKSCNYEPVIYSSYPSDYVDIPSFCEQHDVAFSDFVPSTLAFYYNVVIDALLGIGFDGNDIRRQYWTVFSMLVSTEIPIASVDVPSGWDLTLGPRSIDLSADTFVKPKLLVSLAVPKICSKRFRGDFHFIAGRHVPQQWVLDQGLSVPRFPGPEAQSVLFQTNSAPFVGQTGEIYDKPGVFDATLFTKNPRRTWVDVEEDDELWDELD